MRTYKRKGIRKIKKHTKNKNKIYNRKSIRKIKKYTRKYLKRRGGSIGARSSARISGKPEFKKQHPNISPIVSSTTHGDDKLLVKQFSIQERAHILKNQSRKEAQDIYQRLNAVDRKEFDESLDSHGIAQQIIALSQQEQGYTVASYGRAFGANTAQRYNPETHTMDPLLPEANTTGPMMTARYFNLIEFVPSELLGKPPGGISGIKHLERLRTSITAMGSPFYCKKQAVWAHFNNQTLSGGAGDEGYLDGRLCTGNFNLRWSNVIENDLKRILGSVHGNTQNQEDCTATIDGKIYKLGIIYACIASDLPYNRFREMLGKERLLGNGIVPQDFLDLKGGLVPALRSKILFVKVGPDHIMSEVTDDEIDQFEFLKNISILSLVGDALAFEDLPLNTPPSVAAAAAALVAAVANPAAAASST